MKSLLKDTLNKGHHRKYLSTRDAFGGTKNGLSYGSDTFSTSEEGRAFRVNPPNVSFMQRFHCSTTNTIQFLMRILSLLSYSENVFHLEYILTLVCFCFEILMFLNM